MRESTRTPSYSTLSFVPHLICETRNFILNWRHPHRKNFFFCRLCLADIKFWGRAARGISLLPTDFRHFQCREKTMSDPCLKYVKMWSFWQIFFLCQCSGVAYISSRKRLFLSVWRSLQVFNIIDVFWSKKEMEDSTTGPTTKKGPHKKLAIHPLLKKW